MKIKVRHLPGRPIGPGDDIVISSDKLEEYVQERIKPEVLKARIDEVLRIKSDDGDVISSPGDSWDGPPIEQRLIDLQAELTKLKGERNE